MPLVDCLYPNCKCPLGLVRTMLIRDCIMFKRDSADEGGQVSPGDLRRPEHSTQDSGVKIPTPLD